MRTGIILLFVFFLLLPLQAGAVKLVDRNEALFQAVENEDLKDVKNWLHHGADVNKKNSTGKEPLLVAVEKGNIQLAKALLSKNAKVTNLMLKTAVLKNDLVMVRLLLTYKSGR